MKDIRREHVELALSEARRLGRTAFLERYGFAKAKKYLLIQEDGQLFDSKAVVGVAYGHAHPDRGPLAAGDFSGGVEGAVRVLDDLGYTGVDRAGPPGAFSWSRNPNMPGTSPTKMRPAGAICGTARSRTTGSRSREIWPL